MNVFPDIGVLCYIRFLFVLIALLQHAPLPQPIHRRTNTRYVATLSAIVSANIFGEEVKFTADSAPSEPSATPTNRHHQHPLPPGRRPTLTDDRAQLWFDVTPTNLTNPAETIDIEVGMNNTLG
jgi:hypothetical protein